MDHNINNNSMEFEEESKKQFASKSVTENLAGHLDLCLPNIPDHLANSARNGEENLFESPMSFAYEKKALENAVAKFGSVDLNSSEASTQNMFIIDKYLKRVKESEKRKESTKSTIPLFNLEPSKQETTADELRTIESNITTWQKRMTILALVLRLIALIFVVLMSITFLLAYLHNQSRVLILILLADEIVDTVAIIVTTFALMHAGNLSEYNLKFVTKTNCCVYVAVGVHLALLVLGIVLIYGVDEMGEVKEANTLYQASIIAFVLFGIVKTVMLGYLVYMFKRFLFFYTDYCSKVG